MKAAHGGAQVARAKYAIGPLTTFARPEKLRAWLLHAPPGAEEVYAIGPALGRTEDEAVRIARAAVASGRAVFKQRRVARGYEYIIQRCETAETVATHHAPRVDPLSDAGRLLAALVDVARRGAVCPSNAALADSLEFESRYRARYCLAQLVAGGAVRVIGRGRLQARVVEIVGAGLRTAEPEGANQ